MTSGKSWLAEGFCIDKCIFTLLLAQSQALPSVAENISCEVGS